MRLSALSLLWLSVLRGRKWAVLAFSMIQSAADPVCKR